MNRIRNKLRSQTGASLTFALLLFLVCAVVGSVVLTAGTAAAGRMSEITEMDQRFYSVNSAARLLIELIDDKPVTIVETIPESGIATYEYGDGTELNDSSFDSIVREAAYYYITQIAPDDKVTGRKLVTGADNRYKLNMSTGDIDEIAVLVKEELKDDGTMVLNVENTSNKDKYAMELTFAPDVKKTVNDQETQSVTTWKIAWYVQDVKTAGGNLRMS